MIEKTFFSIAIPFYFRNSYSIKQLKRCINSIRAQSFKDYEIIISAQNHFENINNERLQVINVNGYTTKRLFTIIDNILYFWRKFLSKINLLDKSKSKKYKWKKVYISFNDAHNRFRTKIYEVYITNDNPRFEYVIKPILNTLDAPLIDVIVFASNPPVQDSAKEILSFFLFNLFIKEFIKSNSYLKP